MKNVLVLKEFLLKKNQWYIPDNALTFLKDYIIQLDFENKSVNIYNYAQKLLKTRSLKHAINAREYTWRNVNKAKKIENCNFLEYANRSNTYLLDIDSLILKNEYKEYAVDRSTLVNENKDIIIYKEKRDYTLKESIIEIEINYLNNKTRESTIHNMFLEPNHYSIKSFFHGNIFNIEARDRSDSGKIIYEYNLTSKKLSYQISNEKGYYADKYDPKSNTHYYIETYKNIGKIHLNDKQYSIQNICQGSQDYAKESCDLSPSICCYQNNRKSLSIIDIANRKTMNYKRHNINNVQNFPMSLNDRNELLFKIDKGNEYFKLNIYDENYFEISNIEELI